MEPAKKQEVLKIALDMVELNLRILKLTQGFTYLYDFKEKGNDYRSAHFDATPRPGQDTLPFEVQVKTRLWDEIASHGKAAHEYYKTDQEEQPEEIKNCIDSIKTTYHNLLYRKHNGENGS